MLKKVKTYNLEISSPEEFRPKENYKQLIEVKEIKKNQFASYMMFLGVGLPFSWGQRLQWNDEQWSDYLINKDIYLFLGFCENELIGYFELNCSDPGSFEIKYFGLLPEYIGKGLGGELLSAAVESCYQLGAQKVWLHTCEYDGKNALANYKARGFKVTDEYIADDFVPTKEQAVKLVSAFFRNYIDKFSSPENT